MLWSAQQQTERHRLKITLSEMAGEAQLDLRNTKHTPTNSGNRTTEWASRCGMSAEIF